MEKVKVLSVKPILANDNVVDNVNSVSILPSGLANKIYSSVECEKNENGNIRRSKNSFTTRGSSFSVSVNKGKQNLVSKKQTVTETEKSLTSLHLKDSRDTTIFENNCNNLTSGDNNKPSGSYFPVPSSCFGRSDCRASYNERIKPSTSILNHVVSDREKKKKLEHEARNDFVFVKGGGLYRSNSSLDLEHDIITEEPGASQTLKREYGSHGSINVASTQQDSLFSILQTYNEDVSQVNAIPITESISPKARSKIQKLWDKDKSIFKKFLPAKASDSKTDSKLETASEISDFSGVVITNCNAKQTETMTNDTKQDDCNTNIKPTRRIAFAHYDCQSLAAQLTSSRLKSLLADRSNTTTGASAAAAADLESSQHSTLQNSSEELSRPDDSDRSEEKLNNLVSSCPFFCNEIGGEGERIVSLSRDVTRNSRFTSSGAPNSDQLHRSPKASSISLLEPTNGSSYWCQTLCPYVNKSPCIESIDLGSSFYSTYFLNQEHQNWFGVDDQLGPIAISMKREKVEENVYDNHSLPSYQYRTIVRTLEPYAYQGTIREEIQNQRGDKNKLQGIREAIEYVCPQISFSCLRLGIVSPETEAALVKLDELGIHKKFKVGVLYCRAGQKSEEEMYNNENSGPAFSEFLEVLGQRVRLKNFDKYRGGLDKKTDSTGNYSVYSQYKGCEIMFHVSTLLPFTASNRKQLLRKRHIGNDIVTIIFQEPGALPFSPKYIRSHFQHVFIVVQAINPCTDKTMYSVAVSRFQDVPMFGPPIPECGMFPKSRQFTDFLLAKVINGEIAALRSEKFACMAARTKHEYLKDLAENHSSSTLLDNSSKFSLMGFTRASKKEKSRFKYVADTSVKGALSWNLSVDDATLQQKVDCILGISMDSIVILEESSTSIIFSTSCRSVLGWTMKLKQGFRLFYHQGECLSLNLRQSTPENEGEEILGEILARLLAVTQGAESQEIVLRRNSAGLLGFNVQQDGIITEVEPYGLASKAKLEQGSRLVEICTIALATLTQEQMVDLLKTSVTVSVTVIPPHVDGAPRRGCNVPTCSFLLGCSEGDYENLTPPEQPPSSHPKHRVTQLNRCDRSLSPPRSGSSSGYGTGSSSHSFSMDQNNSKLQSASQESTYLIEETSHCSKDKGNQQVTSDSMRPNDPMGTMSSTSSNHSIDRWSDVASEDLTHNAGTYIANNFIHNSHNSVSQHRQSIHIQVEQDYSPPPPPLPARLYQNQRDLLKLQKKSSRNVNSSEVTSHEYGSDGKGLPLNCKTSYSASLNFENGNYAVPLSIVRPVTKDYLQGKGNTESYYSGDYDNTPSRPENIYLQTSKYNLRRNSSPQMNDLKENEADEPVKKEYLMKSRHSVPRSSKPDEKLNEDHPASSRSEDELSACSSGSPHGFQKLRGSSGGSNSSPSLSSRTHSPHNINNKGEAATQPILRLKQGVHGAKYSTNRNSSSAQSSTLQEELLKLINPDYLSDSESMGAEIRDKKDFVPHRVVNSYTCYEASSSISNKGREQVPTSHTSSLDTLYSLSSNSTSTTLTTGTADISGSLSSVVYECVNSPPFQTIGEVEFSNRKSVFTRSGRRFDAAENQRKQEGDKQENLPEKLRKAPSNEGVVLVARPATVISNSSTASSPANCENREKNNFDAPHPHKDISKSKETTYCNTECSNAVEKDIHQSRTNNSNFASPDINDEWSSLVNTATLAIEKSGKILACSTLKKDKSAEHIDIKADLQKLVSKVDLKLIPSNISSKFVPTPLPNADDVYYDSLNYNLATNASSSNHSSIQYMGARLQVDNSDSNGNLKEAASSTIIKAADKDLKERVELLEKALVVEQQRSGHLKEEVSYLRSENRKLQEDSRAAAHQLHQFTEWFFNTIDKA